MIRVGVAERDNPSISRHMETGVRGFSTEMNGRPRRISVSRAKKAPLG